MTPKEDAFIVTPEMDMWFNISGFGGVALFFLVFWLIARGILNPGKLTRFLRFLSVAMILVPLFFRWYLSSSLLMVLGILMAVAGGWIMYKRKL